MQNVTFFNFLSYFEAFNKSLIICSSLRSEDSAVGLGLPKEILAVATLVKKLRTEEENNIKLEFLISQRFENTEG